MLFYQFNNGGLVWACPTRAQGRAASPGAPAAARQPCPDPQQGAGQTGRGGGGRRHAPARETSGESPASCMREPLISKRDKQERFLKRVAATTRVFEKGRGRLFGDLSIVLLGVGKQNHFAPFQTPLRCSTEEFWSDRNEQQQQTHTKHARADVHTPAIAPPCSSPEHPRPGATALSRARLPAAAAAAALSRERKKEESTSWVAARRARSPSAAAACAWASSSCCWVSVRSAAAGCGWEKGGTDFMRVGGMRAWVCDCSSWRSSLLFFFFSCLPSSLVSLRLCTTHHTTLSVFFSLACPPLPDFVLSQTQRQAGWQ